MGPGPVAQVSNGDELEVAARNMLVVVTKLLTYTAEKEPERCSRRGFLEMTTAAMDLEEALEEELSDPAVDAEGMIGSGHPGTSKDAAVDVMPRTGTQRMAVLDSIGHSDNGLTDEEAMDELGLHPSSVRPRRKELVDGGWVKDSGRTRPTSTGNDAIVWVLTPKALDAMSDSAPLAR